MTEITWRQYSSDDLAFFNPAGDANNDGYDDFICTYLSNIKSNTLYFGSSNVVPPDSLLLYSGQDVIVWSAKYLGDLNGDGKDDFTGLMNYPYIYTWYGNENLTNQCNLTLTPSWTGNNNPDRGLVHGDLNNDGYEDVIGSLPIEYGYNGAFCIWQGGANMNGTNDLMIAGTETGMQMGISMAAGDFNGDGFCDVAASAPYMSSYNFFPGIVKVYAGNAQLADTTVDADENISPSVIKGWSFQIIPNPVQQRQSWKIRFTGRGYKTYNEMLLKVYNLKGQYINAYHITKNQLNSGEAVLSDLNLPAGIYEVSLFSKGPLLKTKKLTIR